MPCYKPVDGFRVLGGGMTPSRRHSASGAPLKVPCGQCIGCRMDYVRDWSIRCVHEASLHQESHFATLTYDDAHLPPELSLVPGDLQLFLKRLRYYLSPQRIRFYACGEYGEKNGRPHYHALLFGMSLGDRVPHSRGPSGELLYQSALLDKAWGNGRCLVGSVNRRSAAYVARYALKKITGPQAADFYGGRHPEFSRMSNRPGIGYSWVKRYETDCFPSAFVVIDGQKHPVPKYYKSQLRDRHEFPTTSFFARDDLDATRKTITQLTKGADFKANSTPERLEQRNESANYRQAKIERI